MKKKTTGMIAAVLSVGLLLSACGSSGNSEQTGTSAASQTGSASTSVQSSSEATPIVGGWTVNSNIETAVITSDAKDVFDKAIAQYTGMGFTPAALLATQVVAGTNYAYLCTGEAVVKDPVPGWYIVVVYNDLKGNAEITSVEEIVLDDIKTTQSIESESIVGGWEVMPPSDTITLPQELWSAFWNASDEYADASLSPLALLATQVVAGSNNLIFCQGIPATDNPANALYVATLHVDPQQNAEFKDVQQFDLTAYIDN